MSDDLRETPFVIVRIDGVERKFPIGPNGLTIGRSDDVGLRINDGKVSGHHAKIVLLPTGYVLLDLNSRNGTTIRGVKIKEHRLVHGDTITIGNATLRWTTADPKPTTPPPARKSRIFPAGRAVYATTVCLLLATLSATVAHFGLDPVRDRWGIAGAIEDVLGNVLSDIANRREEPSKTPATGKPPVVVRHSAPVEPEPTPEMPGRDDFGELSRKAMEILRAEVAQALADGDIARAEKAIADDRAGPFRSMHFLDLMALDAQVAEFKRARATAERERLAGIEQQWKEIEDRVKALMAAEQFDGAKEILRECADPRAPSLLAVIEKAREAWLTVTLPDRRGAYAAMVLDIMDRFTLKRDYAGALRELERRERDTAHRPIVARERENVRAMGDAYTAILAAIAKIPVGEKVSIPLKDERTIEGKFEAISEGRINLLSPVIHVADREPISSAGATMGIGMAEIAMSDLVNLAKAPPTLPLLRLMLYDGDFEGLRRRLPAISDAWNGEEDYNAFLELLGVAGMVECAMAERELAAVDRSVRECLSKKQSNEGEEVVDRFLRRFAGGPALEDEAIKTKITALRNEIDRQIHGTVDGPVAVLRDINATVDRKRAALASLKQAGAVGYLAEGLKDASAIVRLTAVKYLGELKGERAMTALLAALDDPTYEVGAAAADAIRKTVDREKHLLMRIKNMAMSEGHPVALRRQAVIALGGIGLKDQALSAIKDALRDPAGEVRRAAVIALARAGSPEDGGVLVTMLSQEKEADVIAKVAAVLGYFGVKQGAPKVLSFLEKEPERFSSYRVDMIRAVGEMGNPSVGKRLLALTKTEDKWQRTIAADALIACGAKLEVAEIEGLLQDDHELVRLAGVMLLNQGGERKHLERLVKMVEDDVARVEGFAVTSIIGRREREMVGIVIGKMDSLNDRGFASAEKILETLTGKRFDGNRSEILKAWKRWLATDYATYRHPSEKK